MHTSHQKNRDQAPKRRPTRSGRVVVAVTALFSALFALTVSTPIGAAPLSPIVPIQLGSEADVEVEAPDVAGKQVLRPFAKTEPTKQVESLSAPQPAETDDVTAAPSATPQASAPTAPAPQPAAPQPAAPQAEAPAPAPTSAPAPAPAPAPTPAPTVPSLEAPPATTATTAPPPPPPPSGPQLDTGAEGAMVGSVNSMRANQGLAGLSSDGNLTAKARSWAKQMAESNNLSHSGMINGLLGAWSTAGENVGYGGSSGSIMGAFAGSPGHYANIVNANFTHIGVGTYVDANGTLWTTHLFAG